MPILPFGWGTESHSMDENVYMCPGDKIVFNKSSSKPATRGGELDMYRTYMLSELYNFEDGFQIVFKE
jgi:hypothetical protein